MESKTAVGKIIGERSFPLGFLAVSDKFLSHWTSCQEDNLGRKRKMRRGNVTISREANEIGNKRHRCDEGGNEMGQQNSNALWLTSDANISNIPPQ